MGIIIAQSLVLKLAFVLALWWENRSSVQPKPPVDDHELDRVNGLIDGSSLTKAAAGADDSRNQEMLKRRAVALFHGTQFHLFVPLLSL